MDNYIHPIPVDVDGYIAEFSEDIREILGKFREIIKEEAPTAKETIWDGIPTYLLHGTLVQLASSENKIVLYTNSGVVETFKDYLTCYGLSEGQIKFLIGMPLPVDLIRVIIRFCVKDNLKNAVQSRE